MEVESILVSKGLPHAEFSQKAVIDAHRSITSHNHVLHLTSGAIRSSRGKFGRMCLYTRSVCREAASFKSASGKLNLVASTISKTFLRRDCARFFSPHCAAGTFRRSHRDLFATGRGGDPS